MSRDRQKVAVIFCRDRDPAPGERGGEEGRRWKRMVLSETTTIKRVRRSFGAGAGAGPGAGA